MMRPHYETSDDLAEEKRIIKAFCRSFDCKAEKNPEQYYQIDYSLIDDDERLVGVAEVKRRHHKNGDYPSVIISLNKFKAGVEYARLGLVFYLVIGFDDGIYFYLHRPGETYLPQAAWGGRTARTRDAADVEPVVHIPTHFFKKLFEVNTDA